MKPVLENVKQQVGNDAIIVKIDVDKNAATAQAYNVTSIPTLIIFKNGQVKWRKAGIVQANLLIQQLSNYKN